LAQVKKKAVLRKISHYFDLYQDGNYYIWKVGKNVLCWCITKNKSFSLQAENPVWSLVIHTFRLFNYYLKKKKKKKKQSFIYTWLHQFVLLVWEKRKATSELLNEVNSLPSSREIHKKGLGSIDSCDKVAVAMVSFSCTTANCFWIF